MYEIVRLDIMNHCPIFQLLTIPCYEDDGMLSFPKNLKPLSESQLSCAKMLLRKFEPWQRNNMVLLGFENPLFADNPMEANMTSMLNSKKSSQIVKPQLFLLELTLFAGQNIEKNKRKYTMHQEARRLQPDLQVQLRQEVQGSHLFAVSGKNTCVFSMIK